MEEPRRRRLPCPPPDGGCRHRGDQRRPGRGTDLIGHDPQGVAFAGQTEDRADEIRSVPRVDPTRAEHHVAAPGGGHGLLARQFRGPVHPEGCRRVILAVWAGFRAVEDVIRGVMDEQPVEPAHGRGDFCHCRGVDPLGAGGIRLRLVDSGVSGGVHHDGRTLPADDGGGRSRHAQVTALAVEGEERPLASQRRVGERVDGDRRIDERVGELAAHLAGGAEDHDLHAPPRRRGRIAR